MTGRGRQTVTTYRASVVEHSDSSPETRDEHNHISITTTVLYYWVGAYTLRKKSEILTSI